MSDPDPLSVAPRRRFGLLVFDWDGTLSDSIPLIAWSLQAACRDIGVEIPDAAAARQVIGLGLDDALSRVVPNVPASRHSELVARYRDHFIARDEAISLFDGVPAMLAELNARGFLLAIATGKSRQGLARAMAQQDVGRFFVATRCADEGFPKPHPEMLLHLVERTGVAAEETLMIGDTTHDLELARNAGVPSLAVTYGAHSPADLAGLQPLAMAESIPALRCWLRANA